MKPRKSLLLMELPSFLYQLSLSLSLSLIVCAWGTYRIENTILLFVRSTLTMGQWLQRSTVMEVLIRVSTEKKIGGKQRKLTNIRRCIQLRIGEILIDL